MAKSQVSSQDNYTIEQAALQQGGEATGLGKLVVKYFPGQILPSLIAFLAVPVLTRLFASAQYGNYTLILKAVSAANLFGFAWVASCALRFFRPMADSKPKFFGHLFIMIFITVALMAGALAIAWPWLSQRYRALFLLACPLAVVSGTTAVFNSVLRAQGRALAYSLMMVLSALMRFAPGIVLLWLVARSLNLFAAAWTVGIALNLVLLLVLTGAWRGLRRIGPERKVFRDFTAYGLPIMVVGLTGMAISSLDGFIIDAFTSTSQVAYYGVACQLGGAPLYLLGSAVMLAVFPRAVDAYEHGGDYARVASGGLRYLAIIATPILVVLWVLAGDVLGIYAGPEYARGSLALRLIGLATVFQITAHYFRMPFMLHKRTGVLIVIGAISGAVSVLSNLLLVPRIGMDGSAWALLLAYCSMLVLSIVWSRKLVTFRPPARSLIRIALVGAVVCGLALLVRSRVAIESLPAVILMAAACLAVYAVGLYLSGEIRGELAEAFRILVRRRRRATGERRQEEN